MKTDKQIFLEGSRQGTEMLASALKHDIITVKENQQHDWYSVISQNKLNNPIPIIKNGLFKCIYNNYNGYLVFNVEFDEKETFSLYADCLLEDEIPFWMWSAKFTVPFEITAEYDLVISDYSDPTVEIYAKQNRKPDFINQYIMSKIDDTNGPVSFFVRAMCYLNFALENLDFKNLKKGDHPPRQTKADKEEHQTRNYPDDYTISPKEISLNGFNISTHSKKIARKLTSKKPVRMIDCWSVRGHMRHYKNGKAVYIKPYEKGKDKTKRLAKHYNI